MKSGLEAFSAKIEKEINKVMAQGSKAVSKETGVDVGLSITDTVLLGFFNETETSLGFTMAMKLKAQGADGADPRNVVATLMVPVNGRMLSLYATRPYANNEDRLAAEKAVVAWRDAIVAANPRVAGSSGWFDWGSVGRSVVIGAVIGGLLGLFKWLGNRAKRAKPAA
jgi:hypothetical protein